jgi:hypothetical protein
MRLVLVATGRQLCAYKHATRRIREVKPICEVRGSQALEINPHLQQIYTERQGVVLGRQSAREHGGEHTREAFPTNICCRTGIRIYNYVLHTHRKSGYCGEARIPKRTITGGGHPATHPAAAGY